MKKKQKKAVEMEDTQISMLDFLNESKLQAYQEGYEQGIRHSLVTIKSLLKHNNIRMHSKEFWAEYKNLKNEGTIK